MVDEFTKISGHFVKDYTEIHDITESPDSAEQHVECVDCHNSDFAAMVKGPHGSQYTPLLAYRYETEDDTQEDPFTYELCYQCHDRDSIFGT